MQRGDVCLAMFPFGDRPGMKLRPVLLLTDAVGAGAEYVAAYISSVLPATQLTTDILLDPADPSRAAIGLRVTSVLRLHKRATIHHTSLQRRLGSADGTTMVKVESVLRNMLAL